MPTLPVLLAALVISAGHLFPPASDDPTVTWVAGDRTTAINAVTGEERHHGFTLIVLSITKRFAGIKGEHSAHRITEASPEFRIALRPEAEAELAKRPQFVTLVRLTSDDGAREVRWSRNEEQPFRKDDIVPLTLEPGVAASPTSSIVHRAVVTGKLKPGEYAIVIDGRFYDFGVN